MELKEPDLAFKKGDTAEGGIERIAREQIGYALGLVASEYPNRAEAVHLARKTCKRLRGLLRVGGSALGESFKKENACFRNAARVLAGQRDADSLREALERLASSQKNRIKKKGVKAILRWLDDRRNRRATDAPDFKFCRRSFLSRLGHARSRVDSWQLSRSKPEPLAAGLENVYRGGRHAMRTARKHPSTESLHEWRKSVKYHCYHMRILEPVSPSKYPKREAKLDCLGEYLGQEHDLAMLAEAIETEGPAFSGKTKVQSILAKIARERRRLQKIAFALGKQLYSQKPRKFSRAFEKRWNKWRRKNRQPSTKGN